MRCDKRLTRIPFPATGDLGLSKREIARTRWSFLMLIRVTATGYDWGTESRIENVFRSHGLAQNVTLGTQPDGSKPPIIGDFVLVDDSLVAQHLNKVRELQSEWCKIQIEVA